MTTSPERLAELRELIGLGSALCGDEHRIEREPTVTTRSSVSVYCGTRVLGTYSVNEDALDQSHAIQRFVFEALRRHEREVAAATVSALIDDLEEARR